MNGKFRITAEPNFDITGLEDVLKKLNELPVEIKWGPMNSHKYEGIMNIRCSQFERSDYIEKNISISPEFEKICYEGLEKIKDSKILHKGGQTIIKIKDSKEEINYLFRT